MRHYPDIFEFPPRVCSAAILVAQCQMEADATAETRPRTGNLPSPTREFLQNSCRLDVNVRILNINVRVFSGLLSELCLFSYTYWLCSHFSKIYFSPNVPPDLPEVIDKAQHPPYVRRYFRFPIKRHPRPLCFLQYVEKGRSGGFTPPSRIDRIWRDKPPATTRRPATSLSAHRLIPGT